MTQPPSDGARWLRGRDAQVTSDAALAARLQEEFLDQRPLSHKKQMKRKHDEPSDDDDVMEPQVRKQRDSKIRARSSASSASVSISVQSDDESKQPESDDIDMSLPKSVNANEVIEISDDDDIVDDSPKEVQPIAIPDTSPPITDVSQSVTIRLKPTHARVETSPAAAEPEAITSGEDVSRTGIL